MTGVDRLGERGATSGSRDERGARSLAARESEAWVLSLGSVMPPVASRPCVRCLAH